VAIIVIGLLFTSGRYIANFKKLDPTQNFNQFKLEFGSVLTLGLETLVLADVINTIVVEPTFKSLGFLALIILIRTIVTWTLTLETKGCWPWQLAKRSKTND
jgi:uncharacterized membrane protein